jgi:hypothetical protein
MGKFSFLVLFFLLSCSSLNKNMTKSGELSLKGGVFHNQSWSESLVFSRNSWFKELTLIFELLSTRIDKRSPFYQWLSETEKRSIANCEDSLVVVTYAQDPDRISRAMFIEQLKGLGYERFSLVNFGRHLKMHPHYETLSLQLYQVDGLCLEKDRGEKLTVRFPGFKEVNLR